MIDKLKNALDKSVASVSVKSNVFVENTKTSTQINNIQQEIKQLKGDLAETVYAKWRSSVSFQEEAAGYCNAIYNKELQIAELRNKMEQIKNNSKQILGEKVEPGTCMGCGAVNNPAAKFCFHCGAKLQ